MWACRKYWLIAVSSLNSTLFRCWMTFASPFIARPPVGKDQLSGSQGDFAAFLGEHLRGAVSAAPAAGADPEIRGEVIERACAVLGAFAHLPFGHCVAKADVHALSL